MKKVVTLIVVAVLSASASSVVTAASRTPEHSARYALQADVGVGWMSTLVLRHCDRPAPKILLRTVLKRARSFVAYRCP